MAPELFTDPRAADVRSDIYALGIVFYEILARRLPGRRSPMPTKLHPGLPKIVDDVFDRMTQDDPEERYRSVEEVLDAFHGADESRSLLDPRAAVLFLKNPLDELVLKPEPSAAPEPAKELPSEETLPPPDLVEALAGSAPGQPIASSQEVETTDVGQEMESTNSSLGDDADSGLGDSTPPVSLGDAEDEDGLKRRRTQGHRPYSFKKMRDK
jgi:serine/threonine protein kinase